VQSQPDAIAWSSVSRELMARVLPANSVLANASAASGANVERRRRMVSLLLLR
jgi:hypothetical protein